jgi:hypothetical protein
LGSNRFFLGEESRIFTSKTYPMKTTVSFLAFVLTMNVFAQQNDVSVNKYWTQGKAEVNVYELSQNRYKDNHPGQAISVFVTEDFLTDKQVKNEYYTNPKSTWTLKNIQIRKFTTGVYDYSLFSSVFTPIDRNTFPQSLKVTATSQEWCGTIFTQVNLRGEKYKYEQRSYFEKEGDVTDAIDKGVLEDELYTVLRMNPEFLPKGNFQIIPALNFMQLKHLKNSTYKANGSIRTYKESAFTGTKLNEYRVIIPELKRELRIVYENQAPYKIVGWLDTFPSAFDKKLRTTKATLKKQKMLPYWGQNSLQDTSLRKELGLK